VATLAPFNGPIIVRAVWLGAITMADRGRATGERVSAHGETSRRLDLVPVIAIPRGVLDHRACPAEQRWSDRPYADGFPGGARRTAGARWRCSYLQRGGRTLLRDKSGRVRGTVVAAPNRAGKCVGRLSLVSRDAVCFTSCWTKSRNRMFPPSPARLCSFHHDLRSAHRLSARWTVSATGGPLLALDMIAMSTVRTADPGFGQSSGPPRAVG
jgi:hypothetical protein